jgi:hypothetical protein
MIRRISQVFLTIAALVAFTVASPYAMAQEDTTKPKPTVKGEMKEGGKEMGKAGKSMGSNVKHGRIARGGKHFGKHVAHGSKNIAKGTAKAAKKTGSAVKKAVTP